MKFIDVLLLGLAFLFIVIGIDQAIVLGFSHSYWAFMLALVAFFGYNYRKSRRSNGDPGTPPPPPTRKSKKAK